MIKSAEVILLKQPSDHVKREKGSKDQPLDDLLEEYGAWRAEVVAGVNVRYSTARTGLEAIKSVNPLNWGKILKCKETHTYRPTTPDYWPHRRMTIVNRAVHELNDKYKQVIIYRYEHGWKQKDFTDRYGWKPATYWGYISRARRELRKNNQIRKLLGR